MVDRCSVVQLKRGDFMDAGKLIETLLIEAGMSKTELAQKMNVSRQSLYNSLDRDMRASTFFKMMNEMGYDLYYTRDGKSLKKIKA